MRLEPDTMGERAVLLIDPEPSVDVQPEPVLALAEDPPARRTTPTPARGAAGRTLAGQSFEAFFETQYTQLLRAMYLVAGSRHEAEELAQDAFVRAYERWELVRRAANPQGYVYRIGLNLYRSKLRRAARGARKLLQVQADSTTHRDPFGAADDRDAIARALAALPPKQREAVVLVEWMGLTDDEVGAMLGISPVTVRVRIHRARQTLRPILDRGETE